jgi:hypothetical protein
MHPRDGVVVVVNVRNSYTKLVAGKGGMAGKLVADVTLFRPIMWGRVLSASPALF